MHVASETTFIADIDVPTGRNYRQPLQAQPLQDRDSFHVPKPEQQSPDAYLYDQCWE